MSADIKVCSKCRELLPLDEFPWRNAKHQKRAAQCRACCRAEEKIRYAKRNPNGVTSRPPLKVDFVRRPDGSLERVERKVG